MIWIFSFARSGSTFLLDFLSDLFGYEKIFEPFMEEPGRLGGHPDFEAVHDWFRGAPKPGTLDQFKIQDFYLGHIPESEFRSPPVRLFRDKLKNYLRDIHKQYGDKTIVKCVRQQGNIAFIRDILEELGIGAKFLLLKRNPYEVAYSYYRGGGFHKKSTWRVRDVYNYREAMYRGESGPLDKWFSTIVNPLDKLIIAILADYRAFDIADSWLADRSVPRLMLNYEDFIVQTAGSCNSIAETFGISLPEQRLNDTMDKYNINPAKINSGQRDPIYASLCRQSGQRLWGDICPYLPGVSPQTDKLQGWHVKCLLKNLLPFIKPS